MKKILISIMIIAVVAAIAIGGTAAYFSEKSNDVTSSVAMADVSLYAGGPGWVTNLFDMTGVIPGQTWTQDVYVKNTGNAGLYITPTWTPDPSGSDNILLDKAIEPLAPVLVSGASDYAAGIYYLAAGDTAHFQVTIQLKETNAPQNSLQGMTLHYKGGVYGQTNPVGMTAYTVGAL